MRIVHIEDFFFPTAGYQINLLTRIQAKQGHEVTIVSSELEKVPSYYTAFFGRDTTEKDRKFSESSGVRVVRMPIIGFYSGRSIHYPRIFKQVESLNPDAVFVHGEDTLIGMQFIWKSSKLRYPLILDCHMVEMASLHPLKHAFRWFYRYFVTPYILKNEIPLIRVVDVDYVQKCLGIPLERTRLMSLGTDTDTFRPSAEVRSRFRAINGISDEDFVVIYAGKLDVNKGGMFFAESIRYRLTSVSGRNITFLIVGNIEGEYGRAVERIFGASENRILRFPTQDYLDLAPFYQAADLAVFPKQCSLSFFDVQSAGLPIVFEDNEVNAARARFGNAFLFKPEDSDGFRSSILDCAKMDDSTYAEVRRKARQYVVDNFDFLPIAEEITRLIEDEVNKRRASGLARRRDFAGAGRKGG
jgi:glycosyltransferase involved in cell wall biosynthesis